ncbi:P-loop containing nucleoside triphosphate hydrolase protein [Mycena rebaudengoi]|nr:P-loop containing nucleoside triphosphate hydrolase protein [Mycena rebaudengoi]
MASSAALTTANLPLFRSIIEEWNGKRPPSTTFASSLETLLQPGTPRAKSASKDVIVAFRTRPPLPGEADKNFHAESDPSADGVGSEAIGVEFCPGITVTSAEPGVFVAHVPGMKWSGPTLTHKTYDADLAFGPDIQNEEVYQRTVGVNDMLSLVLSGGVGCVLAYGQTGSGKTHTMEGIEHRVARDIFDHAQAMGKRMLLAQDGEGANAETGDIFEFGVTFLELLGKRASDLLESTENVDTQGNPLRTDIVISEDTVGNVRPKLISSKIRSSEELETLITTALAHRRTTATMRNATSSRSHAVLTITVKNTLLPYADEGQLILVDLAGSERYEDSKDHDTQRMEEVRDNNSSLMNLKECVRAKAKMAAEDGFIHIPWRANKLTMLLKPIFDIESRQPSSTLIIAHVSPHIQDSIHSSNTLSYAAPFKTPLPGPKGPAPYDAADPRTWNHAQTSAWITAQFTKAAKKTRLASWNVQAKAVALRGKKLRPLTDAALAELDIGVDIATICPDGSTAKNLAVLYTPQFVERCQEARTGTTLTKKDVNELAVEVIGNLCYLITKAKTRKRTEIMKTRKKVNIADYSKV